MRLDLARCCLIVLSNHPETIGKLSTIFSRERKSGAWTNHFNIFIEMNIFPNSSFAFAAKSSRKAVGWLEEVPKYFQWKGDESHNKMVPKNYPKFLVPLKNGDLPMVYYKYGRFLRLPSPSRSVLAAQQFEASKQADGGFDSTFRGWKHAVEICENTRFRDGKGAWVSVLLMKMKQGQKWRMHIIWFSIPK